MHNTTLWTMVNLSVHSGAFHIKDLVETHYGTDMVCVAGQKLARENRQDQYVVNVVLNFNLKNVELNQPVPK